MADPTAPSAPSNPPPSSVQAKASGLSNLAVRALSAFVLISVSLAAMVADVRTRWLVFALFLSLGAWEFSNMLRAKLGGPPVAWLAALLVAGAAAAHLPGETVPGEAWLWGTACASVVAFTAIGFRTMEISLLAPWIYLHLFGIAFLGVYAAAVFDLTWPYAGWKGIYPFLMVELLIITADTGAYFTGRKWGKAKLAPSISSGKTREGAIGGAVLTVAVSLAAGPFLLDTGWAANLGLGLLMGGSGVVGDLFISIFKRYTGVKDSSHLIPGHGGVLDRFDALFFSAPLAVFYLNLVG